MKNIFLVFIYFSLFTVSSSVLGSEVDSKLTTWSDLRKLNYKTGEMPESIRQLIGKTIKIPGAPGTIRTCDPQYRIDDPSCFVHCFVPLELYLIKKTSVLPELEAPASFPLVPPTT